MAFKIVYHDQVKKDIAKLKLSKTLLYKLKLKIEAVASNPFPKGRGGLGEPLAGNLSGFLKFRFNDDDQVVYQIAGK